MYIRKGYLDVRKAVSITRAKAQTSRKGSQVIVCLKKHNEQIKRKEKKNEENEEIS